MDKTRGLELLARLAGDSDRHVQQEAWNIFKAEVIEREDSDITAREAFPVVASFIDSFDLHPKQIRP